MADVLDLLGVQRDLKLRRARDASVLITLLKADRTAYNIGNCEVIFTAVDKPGGTVKLTKTLAPGSHQSDADGQTLLVFTAANLTPSVDAAQSANRIIVWHYTIVRKDLGTAQQFPHFYGAFSIYP